MICKAIIFAVLQLFVCLVFLTISSYAQADFVYTNNGGGPLHTVSGFSVAADGSLTEIPGSPFLTGGLGSGSSVISDNIAVSTLGNFLYVPNGNSSTISVFTINPVTGLLTPVPGSPFPTGVTPDQIALAVTPDNRFLYAANSRSGKISAFSITANGALSSVPGSPFSSGEIGTGRTKVSPNGRFLFVTSENNRMVVLSISSDGALTQVTGSPFPLGDEDFGTTLGVDVNCAGNLLFVGEQINGLTRVLVLDITASGTLSAISGSPFSFFGGSNSQVVVLSPDDRFLYVPNEGNGKLSVLSVAANGSLSAIPGSPFFVGTDDRLPADTATSRAGTFVYTANDDATISVFAVAVTGMLSEVSGSPFPNRGGFGVSIAAYPSKGCGAAFDICIQDDGSANLLRINSTSGDYQFTNCSGLTLSGSSSLIKRGGNLTLQHYAVDRRVLATLDTTVKRGTASIQLFSQGTTFTITDRNTAINTCACAP